MVIPVRYTNNRFQQPKPENDNTPKVIIELSDSDDDGSVTMHEDAPRGIEVESNSVANSGRMGPSTSFGNETSKANKSA